MRSAWCALLLALFIPSGLPAPPKKSACEQDVEFALAELEKRCGHFFATKNIDWKAVTKEMTAAAKAAKSDSDHLGVLIRLLARLRDGHSEVVPKDKGKAIKPPDEFVEKRLGAGFHLCRNGKAILVKAAWGNAERAGITPGMELVKVDGKSAESWLAGHVAFWRDRASFSTDAQALAFASTAGMTFPRGTRLEIVAKAPKAQAKSMTLTVNSDERRRDGPAVAPEGLVEVAGLFVGKTKAGLGYIQVPKIFDDIPQRMDQALEKVAGLKGLVLDFRGNTGGGCDHDQLFGLFVGKGKTFNRKLAGPIGSYGEHPFEGKVVVLVDAMVVSAGETTSGMFKEEGRGKLIGDDHTAGMSGSKEDIDLPSGMFALHVVTRSNKISFNGGRGIEGIGVAPDELVPYSATDLAAGVDTLLARADSL